MGLFDFFKKSKIGEQPAQPRPIRANASPTKANPKPQTTPSVDTMFPKTIPYKLENVISMRLGPELALQPYDYGNLMEQFDMDNTLLSAFVDDDIKRFLPSFGYLNNDPKKYFESLCFKTEKGLSIAYCIRMKGMLSGMIFLDTPFFNKTTIGLDKWTVSFFLLNTFRGQGVMTPALQRILFIMKEKLGVDKVYALVDKDNTKSIKVLENCFFERTSLTDTKNESYTYRCDLSTINFK